MLIWNKKDSVLKAYKTRNLFFKYGDPVPEDELAPGRKERLLAAGWLKVKKPKEQSKPELPSPVLAVEPKAESKPKPQKKKPKGKK